MTSAKLHPLEIKFNAPAADILEAIEHGFRAQVDVKGKLAELYMSRHLDRLKAAGKIASYVWHDSDDLPDFEVFMPDGRRVVVECKNCRTPAKPKPPASGRRRGADAASGGCMVEIQKTRSGVDGAGKKTRGYLVTHFDVLAVSTFNQNREWRFRFVPSNSLAVRDEGAGVLKVMQPVPLTGEDGPWSDDFLRAVADRC